MQSCFEELLDQEDTDPEKKMKSQRLTFENDLENNLYPLKIGMKLC